MSSKFSKFVVFDLVNYIMKIIQSDSVIKVTAPKKNIVFEQIVKLIIFVVEKQRFQNLIHILITALYFGLRCGKMRIDHYKFCFTDLDGATNGTLVATNAQNTCTYLCKFIIFQNLLSLFFVKNDLEKAHLYMRRKLFYNLGVRIINMFLYLFTKPFVQLLNDVILPLLWLDSS